MNPSIKRVNTRPLAREMKSFLQGNGNETGTETKTETEENYGRKTLGSRSTLGRR